MYKYVEIYIYAIIFSIKVSLFSDLLTNGNYERQQYLLDLRRIQIEPKIENATLLLLYYVVLTEMG